MKLLEFAGLDSLTRLQSALGAAKTRADALVVIANELSAADKTAADARAAFVSNPDRKRLAAWLDAESRRTAAVKVGGEIRLLAGTLRHEALADAAPLLRGAISDMIAELARRRAALVTEVAQRSEDLGIELDAGAALAEIDKKIDQLRHEGLGHVNSQPALALAILSTVSGVPVES